MNIHFIGIDGISMSALAAIMQDRGHRISGSDRKQSPMTKRLTDKGARFFFEQKAEHIALVKPDLVVYTAAIREDNPELQAARAYGCPVLERAVFLGQIAEEFQQSIAVAGTHGKTGTTAMLATVLQRMGEDPTALVGGELADIGGNVRIGQSDIFLTEACEYVGSFLHIKPYTGIILNIGRDHLDYYRDLDHIIETFAQFAAGVRPGGLLVINGDDDNCRTMLGMVDVPRLTYGLGDDCDWTARDIAYGAGGSTFTACFGDIEIPVKLNIPGEHSIYNALAVLATCQNHSLNLKAAAKALAAYHGTRRRFERRGEWGGAVLIDDYAHHPKEISTTLQAARDSYSPQRVIAVFQPHTYSRTKTLMDGFAACFGGADQVIITHTYAAREPYDPTSDSQVLAYEVAKHHPDVRLIKSYEDTAAYLRGILHPGDLLLTLGAGPVDGVIDLLRDRESGQG